jgi:hypothetical protein
MVLVWILVVASYYSFPRIIRTIEPLEHYIFFHPEERVGKDQIGGNAMEPKSFPRKTVMRRFGTIQTVGDCMDRKGFGRGGVVEA